MVNIVSNRSEIKDCEFKGLVKSYSGWGGIAVSGTGRRNAISSLRKKNAKLRKNAISSLRKKAAELGGNVLYIQHLSSGSHPLGVVMDGKAYLCQNFNDKDSNK